MNHSCLTTYVALIIPLFFTNLGCGNNQVDAKGTASTDAGRSDAKSTDALTDAGVDAPTDAAPTKQNECKLGRYAGTATGTIVVPLLGSNLSGTATIEFTLAGNDDPTAPPQFSAGKLKGEACDSNATNCIGYTADLAGTLDCDALKLKNGIISNGQVVSPFGTLSFTGTLDADYDPVLHEFINGTWTGAGDFNSTGSGTWSAAWKGP